jgi:hypothetical protein
MAAQKVPESVGGVATSNAASTNGASVTQGQVMPVVAPSEALQQSTMINKDVVEPQVVGVTAKENEGP